MTFRIGVIGLGKIAQDQHLKVIPKNRDFELSAVVSSRGPYQDIATFKTPSDLFASGIKLDAVSLCMPPRSRCEIARLAIDSDLHLLLERPPSSSVGELEALLNYAKARSRIIYTAWHSQNNAAVDEAQRLLEGKTISKLAVNWKEDVRFWHPGQEWIWEPGGFGVFDPGINAFSILTKIMPTPIYVTESTLYTPSNRSTPIAASVRFKSTAGGNADLVAELDWRQVGEPSWDVTIETTEGTKLLLRKGGTQLFVNGATVIDGPTEEYESIYVNFAKSLKSGESHVDFAPLKIVSDCYMLGRRINTNAFV
jgi:D-galactose 1-dehydrogenase